jgi:short-subunit dehydrogenase
LVKGLPASPLLQVLAARPSGGKRSHRADSAIEQPTCFITGATEDVGKFTALELAGKGFTVVMVARNRHKAKLVKAEVAARSKGHVDHIVADLGIHK